jgi:hypothetical protein
MILKEKNTEPCIAGSYVGKIFSMFASPLGDPVPKIRILLSLHIISGQG